MNNEQKIIMLVDDQAINLTIGKNLLKDIYRVYTIPSAELLLHLLETVTPDLILLDVMMPETSGYDLIKILKDNPKWEPIPVIFLTACVDEESELKGLSLGAVDYIMKPFSAPLLRKRIENQLLAEESKKSLREFSDNLSEMLQQKTDTVISMQNVMLSLLSDMVEFRDGGYTGHASRTIKHMGILLDAIIEDSSYRNEVICWDRYDCALGAQFHDIGKVSVSDAILQKKGKLTDDEYDEVKKHVGIGLQMLAKLGEAVDDSPMLSHTRQIIGGHHERWDGSGYPVGLKGTDIPLEGRLMAIIDVFDSLTFERPYRGAYTPDQARAIIEEGSGTDFEPELVRLFLKKYDLFKEAAEGL